MHEEMVRYMAMLVSKAGYGDVKANLPESERKPERIRAHEKSESFQPDISGVKDGRLHILEIETHSTIRSPDTLKRLKAFAVFADRNKADFTIVVPDTCRKIAHSQLEAAGIFARILDIVPPSSDSEGG
jgi:hypothetical protein